MKINGWAETEEKLFIAYSEYYFKNQFKKV